MGGGAWAEVEEVLSEAGAAFVPSFIGRVPSVLHTAGERGQQAAQSRGLLPSKDLGSLSTCALGRVAWWG